MIYYWCLLYKVVCEQLGDMHLERIDFNFQSSACRIGPPIYVILCNIPTVIKV